jgi:TonB family protein
MIGFARPLLDVLFASIWQGACIAVIAASTLAVAGRRVNAATRHLVLECALVAVAIVPIATTLPSVKLHGASVSLGAAPATPATEFALVRAFPSRRIDVLLSDSAVLALTAAWLAGALFFAMRIGIGPLRLRRLLRRSSLLAHRDGIPVRISSDVALPLAVGFSAPSVILPFSLARPAARVEFECALLHELAHVRRGDAWANALDRLLHAILFFNPAVLLLLRRIAFEREAACDDVAVAQSRDTALYTRSLAALAIAWAQVRQPSAFGSVGFACPTLARIDRLERRDRNGSITISRFALGGFAAMFVTIAILLQALAPAVAFSAPVPATGTTVATAACTASASVVDPAEPKVPSGTPKVAKPSTAQIAVKISPSGSVLGATVYKSSGRSDLDRATLEAAVASTYAPAKRDCVAVAGSYLFTATFAPDRG